LLAPTLLFWDATNLEFVLEQVQDDSSGLDRIRVLVREAKNYSRILQWTANDKFGTCPFPIAEGGGRQASHAGTPFARGVAHLDRGEIAQAAEAFAEAVRREPADYVSWYNLGLVFVRTGHVDEAFQALNEAVARRPEFADALSSLGYLYNQRREWVKAWNVLHRAVTANPRHADAWYNLGISILYAGGDNRANLEIVLQNLRALNPASASEFEQTIARFTRS
jgi:Tfp pilus assembly protein PilF